MTSIVRVLLGISLFTLGFQLGRAVGRTDPIAEELKRMKRRQGIVINGELSDEAAVKIED